MKLAIFLICASVARAELSKEFLDKLAVKVKGAVEECTVESKASPEDVQMIINHQITESHEGQCFLFCFHKKFEIQNDDGSVNKEKALSILSAIWKEHPENYDKFISVVHGCMESVPVNEDSCIYAADLAKCGLKQGKAFEINLDEILTTS